MTATCIDLKARYARSYRVASEDGNGRNADVWLWIIPCRRGHLYPHGGDRIGAATTGRRIGQMLARLPGVRVEQEGDDGYNLSFPVSEFAKVAAIMRPKRRRRLTPEQREKLAAIGRENLKRIQTKANGDRQSVGQAAEV